MEWYYANINLSHYGGMKMLKIEMEQKIASQEKLLDALRLRVTTAIEDADRVEQNNVKLKGIIANLELEVATLKGYATRVIQVDNAKNVLPPQECTGYDAEPFQRIAAEECAKPFSLPLCSEPSGEWVSVKSDCYPYAEQNKRINWYEI